MKSEIEKTIIRIVQDYCLKLQIQNLVLEFSLTVAPSISRQLQSAKLTHQSFLSICKKRNDFFSANHIESNSFIPHLYKHLKHELSYYDFKHNLNDALIEYKKRIENGNFKGFPRGTTEDTLRSNLAIYINYENFCEPRCGSGNCDILIPSQRAIIETKLWKGIEYYNSGIPELAEYLKKQNYDTGYYVIYDYNKFENEVTKTRGHIFKLDSYSITVIFIRMADIAPSKIYKHQKAQNDSTKEQF